MNIISLEELEKFTDKLYGSQTDASLLEWANMLKERYLQNFSYGELFSHFIASKNKHCLFWLLDVLITLVVSHYKTFSDQDKAKFRESVIFIVQNHTTKIFTENFILNKFCLVLINLVKFDYPEQWPGFFKNFMSLIYETKEDNLKILKVELLVNLLLTFDDELIKFRHTYTEFEVVRSTVVKDYMREDAVGECIYVINGVLENEKHFSKKLVKNSIKVISQLIDWNSLNLFEESIRMTVNLITQPEFEIEGLDLLNAIIEKGMELIQKIELIKYLNINDIITSLMNQQRKINENTLSKICEIVNNIGNLMIECFEYIKSVSKGEVPDSKVNVNDLFNYICELTNYTLYHSINIINLSVKVDVKICLPLCDFISNFTTYLKTNDFLAETLNELLKSLVTTVENSLTIPANDYDIKTLLVTDNDDFFNFRKEYTVLYNNFFCLTSLKLFILNSIINRLQNVSHNIQNNNYMSQVEVTLHLIYSLQTSIHNNDVQNSQISEHFNKVLYSLFTIPFADVDSDFILILFYDTVYKYLQYIITNDNILIYITKIYLSKRGILYDNPLVGSRICASFDKFVDKTKLQLSKLDIIYEIAESLKGFIQFLCNDNKNFQTLCEYNILFRTLCQALLQKNFNEDKRAVLFREVLSLFDSIIINYGLDVEKFIELAKCITNFVKCIGFEVSPAIKIIFVDYFNNFINNIYLKFPKNAKVDYSMLTIIQRLVTILGKDSLQYVEYFIQEQVKHPEYDQYEDYCKLLQNVTQLLKKESKGIVQNLFFYFYSGLKNIKLPDSDISEVDKNILTIFSNFAKLLANVTNDLVEVLFENGGLKNVDLTEFINFVIYVSCDVIDPSIRRSLVKSLKCIVIYILKLVASNEYSQTIVDYLELFLSGTFRIYSRLNITDPIDFNTLPEIVQLHFYVLKGVQNYYVSYIANFLDNENLQIFIDHLNVYDVKKFKVGDILLNYFNYISLNNFSNKVG